MSTGKRIDKYYKKKAAERRAAEVIEGEAKTLALDPIDWRLGGKILGLVAAVVLASYMYTLWGGYVYCDSFNLSPLRTVTREWSSAFLYLISDAFVSPLSQPLVKATFATDIAFGTYSSTAVFHGDSLCLHLGNCVLLFILAFKLAGLNNQRKKKLDLDPYVVGAAAAILFACHPLASESVAYISARSALLVTFNYFLALLCFLRGFLSKEIKDGLLGYGFSYFFMLMAIFSGPQALTAAAAMIFLALMVKPEEESWKRWLKARPLEMFAIALVALVVPFVLLLKYKAPILNGFGLTVLPPAEYIATQCKTLLTYYLRVALVPVGLSLDPPLTVAKGFTDPLAIGGALVPIAFLALAWKYRASLLVSFPLVLFVLALLPDFFLPQPEIMSDRRMYLPLAALCIPFGLLVARMSEKRLALTLAGSVVLVVTGIGLTNWRNHSWQLDNRLWEGAYQINPNSDRSRIMRVWAKSRGNMDEAVKLAQEEIKVYPDSALLNLVLGKYYNATRKFKEGKQYYAKALSLAEKQNLSPEVIVEVQTGLAYAAMQTGDMELAKETADRALKTQPNNARLHLIKGEYYLTVDQPQAAVAELNKAHTLDRYNPEVYAPLARAMLGCGTGKMQDLGYQAAMIAARVNNDTKLELLKSYAALETGRVHEAMLYMDKYRKQHNATPEMYYILHGILKKLKADNEAEAALKIATSSDPDIKKKIRLYLNRDIVLPPGTPEEKLKAVKPLLTDQATDKKLQQDAGSSSVQLKPGEIRGLDLKPIPGGTPVHSVETAGTSATPGANTIKPAPASRAE